MKIKINQLTIQSPGTEQEVKEWMLCCIFEDRVRDNNQVYLNSAVRWDIRVYDKTRFTLPELQQLINYCQDIIRQETTEEEQETAGEEQETAGNEEHKKRHIELHSKLDELVADWITHTGNYSSKSTVFDLIEWSFKQCSEPTEKEQE